MTTNAGESARPVQYGTVEAVERLSPTMIRVVFGGPGLAAFDPTEFTDQYVNALFIPEGAPYAVPFDIDVARTLAPAHRPRGRRYTIRSWDPAVRLLTIDFVAHGDSGYAGRWAQRAAIGDRLQIDGPSGGYRPAAGADWHLMVGDESALPAIAASLEALPVDRACTVIAVVDDVDHQIELPGGDAVERRWVHRRGSADPEQLLVDEVSRLPWRDGVVDVFVHGEAAEVRAVRRHLLAERGVERSTASISPYWRRDHTDEAWRAIKRDWLAEQAPDA